jgi:predicted alpha-1,6-mannanase (GH76 family)
MKIICSFAILLSAGIAAFAFTSRDADAAFDAYNTNFYVVHDSFGFYKTNLRGGRSDFWKQAEQIEMIEDAFERTGSAAHRQMIAQSIAGFTNHFGLDWTWNKFNDDIIWMTIACARGFLATSNNTYRALAEKNFDAVYSRGWDTRLGGGLWWTTDRTGKHACINSPAVISACLLFQISGDKSYLTKAKAIYAWERSALFNLATGAVGDNIKSNGVVNPKVFTYNEGTFIGAANYLCKLTGDTNYFDDALLAANFTKNILCGGGKLPAYGSGDAGGFNGIFMRWLVRFVKDNNLWPKFYDWMSANADAAWSVRRADNLSWQNWNADTPPGTLDSWDCSDTVVLLQVLPPKSPAEK